VVFAAATAIQPQTILTIDPKHRLIEGIASDGETIWVSSVLDRQILECRKICRTIVQLPKGLHPLGIAWDWGRKLIWVAADCPGVAGIEKCQKGALVAIDREGKQRGKVAPNVAEFHPGDVSASASGVFVSDTHNGLVYALLPRRQGLRPVNRAGDGMSAQGNALTPAGTQLLLADYSHGIGLVDLRSKATSWLPRQDGKPLRGVDGLIRCGDRYFGIYNGSAPGTLLVIKPTATGIRFDQPLGTAVFPDPTQIAFDGKRLLIVSDSGWANVEKAGYERRKGAAIVAVPLTGDCEIR